MANIIILLIILAIIIPVVGYLIRAKKKGKVCVGCPYAGQCKGKCQAEGHNETTC